MTERLAPLHSTQVSRSDLQLVFFTWTHIYFEKQTITAYYNLYLWQVKSTFTEVKQFHHQLFLILPTGNHLYLYHELFWDGNYTLPPPLISDGITLLCSSQCLWRLKLKRGRLNCQCRPLPGSGSDWSQNSQKQRCSRILWPGSA
jgi:hypothetical protein